ncbi:NADH-quinone oxidoreductase subunit C [Streptomyces sp. AK02-01A]|uniref:NADH-quinone oxidoreductase subunit C n=1 Tax=Streptomyces sp. AK02-01A TaxID=3028648 RepID=UPI0029B9A093|nr:NADH-quinone oxidoreductase subunit C [Streptomyces sp. AK02-01A]MDX3851192.1 NADH-quinone oxidoreductase subunit C [Streptomyces sp. AK02-01A]
MNAHDAPGPNDYDRLPDAVTEIFGADATAERAYDLLTVDVPPEAWIGALETARDRLRCSYFDWLSAVDEPGAGFRVCAHVAALEGGTVRRLLVRTTVPHAAAVLPTAVEVYAGAGWHERETHEMFGIAFTGHPNLAHLLLPETFEGHPLRKDFVLAARVAKAWPGAKEPGEPAAGAEHSGPRRRQMLPPGVPDPNEWGPLKGQLPPAPSRPARTARAAGDRPVRAARGVPEGSAPPRRTRGASEGSASRPAPARTGGDEASPEDSRPASPVAPEPPREEGTTAADAAGETASGATPGRRSRSASEGSASQRREPSAPDAPWHKPRQAFGDDAAAEGEEASDADAEEASDADAEEASDAEDRPDKADKADKAGPGEPEKAAPTEAPESDRPEGDA